jgi:hypothetical protein
MLNKENLYALLDIEEAADFQYFENLAALFECEEEIQEAALFQLISDVDKQVLSELIHNYFEEMTDFLPGDAAEVYSLLERIKLALMGLARGSEQEENLMVNLAEELERFRRWYADESRVICTPIKEPAGETAVPMRDAVTMARIEKLEGDKYEYDFSQCMDYPLEEYIMSLGDMVAAEYEEEEEDGMSGSLDS